MSRSSPANPLARAQERSHALRGVQSATLLVLVMMAVSASPGLLKCGVANGNFGNDRLAEIKTRTGGERHLFESDDRQDNVPAAKPSIKPSLATLRDCIVPASLPYEVLCARPATDMRAVSLRRLTAMTLALPPPRVEAC